MRTHALSLGEHIARHRRAIGLTQSQLAEKVGVQPITISRIETGRKTTSLDVVAQIAQVLGVELHELFRQWDEQKPKERVTERLLWFISRLSPAEVELIMDVGAVVLTHTRRLETK